MSKKIKWGVYLSVIATLFRVGIGHAMEVSGTQTGIWNLTGSPYIVTSTVTVPSGETLIIESKVEVRFASNTGIVSYGTLTAVGAPDGTITFTSNESIPSPGDWNSIKFNRGNAKGTISYCEIMYCQTGYILRTYPKNQWMS